MLRITARELFRHPLRRDVLPTLNATYNRNSSTRVEPVVQNTEAGSGQQVADASRFRSKLPQRKPLVKNFFLGIVDKELLRFPEVISRDDTSKLDGETAAIRTYFCDSLASRVPELSQSIPSDVTEILQNLGLYGFSIPSNYGGKGYTTSELSVASEHEQISADIGATLMAHRVVSELMSQFGTNKLKEKYLQKMASGTIIASEAIFESKPTDAQFFGTTAAYNEHDKIWTLNGEKSFVINGQNANLFLVLAQVHTLNVAGDMADGMGIFLVDSNLPGITIETNQPFGLKGAQQGTIRFENVDVVEDNVLGEPGKSEQIAQSLLKIHRIKNGLMCSGLLKNIIKEMTDYTVNTKHGGIYLKDMKHISDRLARLVCSTYAIESMAYLTTGLIDEFEDQDVDLEAAILKRYALESLWKCATDCMHYMGPKCLEAGQTSEIFIRNAAQLYTQSEPMDSLRQFIGLSGIQHAGMNIHETIRKDRNPLFFPMHVIGRMFEKHTIDTPKMTLKLEAEVHPSLDHAAKCLEQSILRLRIAVELLLGHYGSEILTEPLEVARVNECITLIYASFASVARASRSYCIGLQHSDYELLTATIIAMESNARVKVLIDQIVNGPYANNDKNLQKIAKQLFKSHQYFYEHPLKYNF